MTERSPDAPEADLVRIDGRREVSASAQGAATAESGADESQLPRLNRRVLVVDDSPAIHRDFLKILQPRPSSGEHELDELEAALFGQEAEPADLHRELALTFEVDTATQGQEAQEMVARALGDGRPYALAFVDIRMPPGWDGIETTRRLWAADAAVQVVVCSAYSDYSWDQMAQVLGVGDGWVILKKPFDPLEVRQLAHALCRKWDLYRENQSYVGRLEALVRDRTRDLAATNEQLTEQIQGRRLVEAELRRSQKLEALGRLAAGMGHEINNPLTYVVANIDFVIDLLDQESAAPQAEQIAQMREDLGHARMGADRIGRIVQDMRIFSRMREEEDDLGPVSLGEVLDLASKMVASEVRSRAQLVRRFDEVPRVWGIQSRLEQVFVNLIINAAQALPAGQAKDNRISLVLRRARDDDQRVVVEIQDTGVGIAAEDLERVFDPFFTSKAIGEGTGLGLSICHGIVTSLGGTIEVDSAVGEGTTVRVTLPVAGERQVASPRPASPRVAPAAGGAGGLAIARARPSGKQPRVLVVDDEELVLSTLKRLLEPRCLVQICHSGREALAICEQDDFDVVLCDLMMGDLTGMDLYDQLKQRQRPVVERFVFITGGAYTQRAEEFLEAVPNPNLTKPIDVQQLHRMVDQLVGQRQAG